MKRPQEIDGLIAAPGDLAEARRYLASRGVSAHEIRKYLPVAKPEPRVRRRRRKR